MSATEIGSVLIRLVYSFSSLIFLLAMDYLCLTYNAYVSLCIFDAMLFCSQMLGGRENTFCLGFLGSSHNVYFQPELLKSGVYQTQSCL